MNAAILRIESSLRLLGFAIDAGAPILPEATPFELELSMLVEDRDSFPTPIARVLTC